MPVYIIKSEANLFWNSLYAWVQDERKAVTFDTEEQARDCIARHDWTTAEVFAQIEIDGRLAHAAV